MNAPSSTGKTFLINLILDEIRANKEIVLALASLEIATTLMDSGRRADYALKLRLNVENLKMSFRCVTLQNHQHIYKF